jgi:RNA polymerase sigma-70 factor (ECF subfamily)
MRRAVLRDAVNTLELRERELVALRFFAGLSHAEIAQVLGISASNAGTRLHRAIDKLRRACDENA